MKGKFEDLSGRKFSRLTVLGYLGDRRWWCECVCGNKAIVRTDGLKSGHSKSCGCLQKESVTKHGFWNTEYSKGTMKFYLLWRNMRARCNNPKNKAYHNYGGRGITYDKKWDDFSEFKKDMYFQYLYATKQKKMSNASIERKDVNKGYFKENCCFIEFVEQMKNTRNVLSFIARSPDGEEIVVRNANEFCKVYGLTSSHVYECLKGVAKQHKGWQFKKEEEDQYVEFEAQNARSPISFIATSPEGKKSTERNANEFAKKHGLNNAHICNCLKGVAKTHKGWKFRKIDN